MGWLSTIITGAVSPIAGYFTKKNENKTAIKAKNIDRIMNAEDKAAEWEAIMAESGNNTWKDEYITIIVTIQLPCLFLAVVLSVLTGNPIYAESAKAGIAAIKELMPNYEDLMFAVCLAAIGIRAVKR